MADTVRDAETVGSMNDSVPTTETRSGTGPRQTWVTNWSDREHADFTWAWEQEEVEVRVVRAPHLGSSVPQSFRRAWAWPGYARMANEGLRAADGPRPTMVAWQAIAGGIAATRRRSRAEREAMRIIAMNPHPLQNERPSNRRQKLLLSMMRRVDAVVFYSRSGLDQAVDLGLDPARCHFMPLGVRPIHDQPPAPGRYLLSVGRSHRDWATLATAAESAGVDVLVSGPEKIPASPRLHRIDAPTKSGYLSLMDGARAVVIPILDASRQAGHFAILDAFALGRAVVATDVPGVNGYLDDSTGARVPVGDAEALAVALRRLSDPEAAAAAGAAAFDRAATTLNLRSFVRRVGELAETVWQQPANT